jgi:hypothetical protein
LFFVFSGKNQKKQNTSPRFASVASKKSFIRKPYVLIEKT